MLDVAASRLLLFAPADGITRKSLTYIFADGAHNTARNNISVLQTDQQDPLWITGMKMNILFVVKEEKAEEKLHENLLNDTDGDPIVNLVCASRTLKSS